MWIILFNKGLARGRGKVLPPIKLIKYKELVVVVVVVVVVVFIFKLLIPAHCFNLFLKTKK